MKCRKCGLAGHFTKDCGKAPPSVESASKPQETVVSSPLVTCVMSTSTNSTSLAVTPLGSEQSIESERSMPAVSIETTGSNLSSARAPSKNVIICRKCGGTNHLSKDCTKSSTTSEDSAAPMEARPSKSSSTSVDAESAENIASSLKRLNDEDVAKKSLSKPQLSACRKCGQTTHKTMFCEKYHKEKADQVTPVNRMKDEEPELSHESVTESVKPPSAEAPSTISASKKMHSCPKCGEQGHDALNCSKDPIKAETTESMDAAAVPVDGCEASAQSKKSPICRKCGMEGHLALHCEKFQAKLKMEAAERIAREKDIRATELSEEDSREKNYPRISKGSANEIMFKFLQV